MKNLLLSLVVLAGMVALVVAAVALTGVAIVRKPDPGVAGAATILILLLPVLGVSALFPRRSSGLVLGAILWPLLVLAGLPLYFPGERQDALNLGFNLVGAPLGPRFGPSHWTAWAHALDQVLPTPRSRALLPPATIPIPPPLPPSTATDDEDQVIMPYEGTGHSMQIPVTVEGPKGQTLEVNLLFDTGATYSTLDTASLQQAGYTVSPSAPTITSHTANGPIESALVRVDRYWVGGLEVEGVTVAVCDVCAEGMGYKGVLGLNVSGRFLVTLDTARREMVLKPRFNSHRTYLDIEPWIKVDGHGTRWADGRTEVELEATSHADRPVHSVEVAVRCPGGDFSLALGDLTPGQRATGKVAIPREGQCERFQVVLAGGPW